MYKSMFINLNSKYRESKLGGGVGFYIKEHMTFSLWEDLGKTDELTEIIWIKVQGRNKNTLVFIWVVYQPSSNDTEKLIWLSLSEF